MNQAVENKATVAQLVENLNIGGLEQMVLALAKRLNAGRFHCVLFCLGDGGPLAEAACASGIDVEAFHKKPGLDYSLPFKLAKALRKKRVDILQCHNYGPLVYGCFAGRLAKITGTVYTSHGMKTSRKNYQRFLYRLGAIKHIVTVSENARRILVQNSGISSKRVTTIPNGINWEDYAININTLTKKASIGIEGDPRLIGIVARLSPEKDHETLLEAFSIFGKEFSDVELVVVGGGDLLANLKDSARRLEIESRVHFLEYRADVQELMAIFECFVLCSRSEGLSMTLLEAMAAGLPVVATDVGGNREVVQHEETGLLVPAGEPQQLAEGLKRIFADNEKARQMGEKGRIRVQEHFSLGKMIGSYEQIYEDLLREYPSPANRQDPRGY
jgi:glycosyltransferase involved in cell wall biosynthesis